LATFGEFEFEAEHCEHRQEFAGTKFRRASALEAGQGFRGYASLVRNRFLPQAESLAAGRHCGSQFLECLHIDMYVMIWHILPFIDLYINILAGIHVTHAIH
jgi:hypothetical protein